MYLAAALIGAVLGLLGGTLADVLPGRYGITHFASPVAQRRRNLTLVVLSSIVALGIAHLLLGVPDLRFGTAVMLFAVHATVAVLVLVGGAVDVEHMILPNEITFGVAALCLLTSPLRGVGIEGALIGAVGGAVLTYGPFLLYKRLRGRSGMGLGDAKLAIAAGAWHGLEGAVFVVFAGALQSLLAAGLMRVFGLRYATPESVRAELAELRARAATGDAEAKGALADDPMAAENDESLLDVRLPLGPFLVLACIEVLFLRHWLVVHVFSWFFSE